MHARRTKEKIEKFCDESNFLFAVDKGVKKVLYTNRRYAPAKKKKFDADRKAQALPVASVSRYPTHPAPTIC